MQNTPELGNMILMVLQTKLNQYNGEKCLRTHPHWSQNDTNQKSEIQISVYLLYTCEVSQIIQVYFLPSSMGWWINTEGPRLISRPTNFITLDHTSNIQGILEGCPENLHEMARNKETNYY